MPETAHHHAFRRCQETGNAACLACNRLLKGQVSTGFRGISGLRKELEQWTRKHPAYIVLFGGHHSSQQALTRAFGLGLKAKARGVVVVGLPSGEAQSSTWRHSRTKNLDR